jgi:hypothetical protein
MAEKGTKAPSAGPDMVTFTLRIPRHVFESMREHPQKKNGELVDWSRVFCSAVGTHVSKLGNPGKNRGKKLLYSEYQACKVCKTQFRQEDRANLRITCSEACARESQRRSIQRRARRAQKLKTYGRAETPHQTHRPVLGPAVISEGPP